MTKKTVGIDCRLGGLAHAGIGRYITELVRRITKSTPEIQWVLFCFDSAQAEELVGRNPTKNIKIVYTPIRQYTLKEQYLLPFIFAREKLDLLHVPHFNLPILYTGPVVITIHDLLWHQYRGSDATTLSPFIYWFKYWGYRLVATAAITRAQQIFVPTQTVANTVEQYYQRSSAKILVTKEGIAEELLNKAQTMNTTTRESGCILYVGSLYPHK
nr:glycosyltransferase [Candidatus Woesebacteria bacterium]